MWLVEVVENIVKVCQYQLLFEPTFPGLDLSYDRFWYIFGLNNEAEFWSVSILLNNLHIY